MTENDASGDDNDDGKDDRDRDFKDDRLERDMLLLKEDNKGKCNVLLRVNDENGHNRRFSLERMLLESTESDSWEILSPDEVSSIVL